MSQERTTRRLRVGVIGAGGIAQMMHLPHMGERPDLFEIVSLADVSARTLSDVGARYGVRHLTADYHELCARTDVEAVLLLSSGSHRDAAIAALKAGKHLFVEKPLGYGLKETGEIAGVAKASGRTMMVGYHKRFDPAYRRAREAVRAMSDLRYVDVTVLHPDDGEHRVHHAIFPDPDRCRDPAPEEVDLRNHVEAVTAGHLGRLIDDIAGPDAPEAHRVAARLLCDSLIHDLNALRGILGEPDEVISSHIWKKGFAQTSVSRFGQDVRANVSWILLPGLRHYEETVRFIGARDRVTLTFPSPYLKNYPTPLTIERMDGGELVVEQRTVSFDEAFRAELIHFRDCVLSGTRPELTEDDALGDARWIHAIAAASRSGGSR